MSFKKAAGIIGGSIVGLIGLSAAVFVSSALNEAKNAGDDDCDYLIILGCRVYGSCPTEMLAMRIERAIVYMKKHPQAIAIAAGGCFFKGQRISEAMAIRNVLVGFGIEDNRILIEENSRNTYENLINSRDLILKHEGDSGINDCRIAILTSDFHLFRAGKIAEKCGMKANKIAANSPASPVMSYTREYVISYSKAAFELLKLKSRC